MVSNLPLKNLYIAKTHLQRRNEFFAKTRKNRDFFDKVLADLLFLNLIGYVFSKISLKTFDICAAKW